MATLVNRDVWYDIASGGPYNSSIGAYTVNWYNVIQAKWTSVSGTIYTVRYRCVLRKNSGTSTNNVSSYNGYSIGGTGATTVSASNINITYPNNGDNEIAITNNGTVDVSGGYTITVNGGVKLGYYGTTWGSTTLSGTATLPAVAPSTPILSIGEVTSTSASIIWRCNNYGTSTGTAYLYGGTAPSPTTELSTTTSTSAQTYTQTGLDPGTTYYFRSRAKSSNNTWGPYSPDLIIRTLTPRAKFYGPDNGEAASTVKILGGVNGTAQNITKLYGSVNGEAKIIHQSFGHLSYE